MKELTDFTNLVDDTFDLFKKKIERLEKDNAAATQRVQQLEKALSYISTFAKTSETDIAEGEPAIAVAYDLMIEQARDALTPKPTADEPVN